MRHAFFFSLAVAYACLAPNISLESRILPAFFLTGMVWVCFYPEILRLYVRYFCAMKVHHLAIVICNHALDLMPDNQLFLQDRHDALMALSGYEEASGYSERAARIAARFGQRWYGSALAMLWLAADESAANLTEKAVKLAPRNSFALLMRASVRHSKGDLQGCFEDCARIDPMGKLGGLGRRLSSLAHIELANFEAA